MYAEKKIFRSGGDEAKSDSPNQVRMRVKSFSASSS